MLRIARILRPRCFEIALSILSPLTLSSPSPSQQESSNYLGGIFVIQREIVMDSPTESTMNLNHGINAGGDQRYRLLVTGGPLPLPETTIFICF